MGRKPYQTIMEEFPEHLQAIGTLAVEIVNLEVMLADLLSAMLRIPRRVGHEIYFSPRANSVRVLILQNAAAELLASVPETRGQVISLAKRSLGAINERSDVLHAAWGTSNRLWITRRSPPLTRVPKEATARAELSDITNLVGRIRVLTTEAVRLTREFETAKNYAALLRTLHKQDRAEIQAEARSLANSRKGVLPKPKLPPAPSRA